MYPHVKPFRPISIGSYTLLHLRIPGLVYPLKSFSVKLPNSGTRIIQRLNVKQFRLKYGVVVSGAICMVSNMDVLVDNVEFCSVYHGEVVARQCCNG